MKAAVCACKASETTSVPWCCGEERLGHTPNRGGIGCLLLVTAIAVSPILHQCTAASPAAWSANI